MQQVDSLIAAKIASLRPFAREDWESGPHTEEELQAIEQRLGRSLDPDHRDMLKEVGGPFRFEFGAVDVGDSGLDVAEFFSASPRDRYNNIAELWHGARDRIPQTWYPFAKDFDGLFYCLTDQGAVHHVEFYERGEELPAQVKRPATAGKRVADSFVQFVMSLRLPDWVVAHLRDSGETNKTPRGST